MLTDDEAVVVALGTLAAGRSGCRAPPSRSTARSRRSTASSRTASGAAWRHSRRPRLHDPPHAALRPWAATSCCFSPMPSPAPPAAHGLPLLRRRGDGARAQPTRARRAHGAVVPRGVTTTAVTTCARSGWIGSAGRLWPRSRQTRRRPASTPSPTSRRRSHARRGAGRWRCSSTSPREAARRVPATLAELIEEDAGTLLRIRVASLDWAASVLAGLGCGFTMRRPEELRSIRALAERLALSA